MGRRGGCPDCWWGNWYSGLLKGYKLVGKKSLYVRGSSQTQGICDWDRTTHECIYGPPGTYFHGLLRSQKRLDTDGAVQDPVRYARGRYEI